MTRKPGYYWAINHFGPVLIYWDGENFYEPGVPDPVNESAYSFIDTKNIKEPKAIVKRYINIIIDRIKNN